MHIHTYLYIYIYINIYIPRGKEDTCSFFASVCTHTCKQATPPLPRSMFLICPYVYRYIHTSMSIYICIPTYKYVLHRSAFVTRNSHPSTLPTNRHSE